MNEEGANHSSGTCSIPWNEGSQKNHVGAEFISLRIANSAFAEGTSYLYLYAVSPFSTSPVHNVRIIVDSGNPSRLCKLKNFLL